MAAAREYTTYPYRVEYPDAAKDGRSCKTLEDALWEARSIHSRWREGSSYGTAGDWVYPDVDRAVITNRNTGYRWSARHPFADHATEVSHLIKRLTRERLRPLVTNPP